MSQSRRSSPVRRKFSQWIVGLCAVALAAAGLTVVSPPQEAEAAAPGPKDTIAVLFSYTWDSIAQECERTLGPAGYGYVQTSPPQEHIQGGPWWIYYQPVSYRLESRMGTEAEFRSMVERCNDAGVGVIVDAVINHMSGQSGGGVGWAGSQFQHYNYPGLYSSQDFHNCRSDIGDYQNRWEVQNCNLVNLADLDTGSAYVQQTIADYLNGLVDMGVAGFRIDAVKHISAQDMWGIWNRVNNKDDLYIVQEVIRADEPIQPEEYIGIGDIHEFAFARKLKEAFGGSEIGWLISPVGIGAGWSGFLQQADAATFVDNHDTERNDGETLSYKDGRTYDLAQFFTLAWPYGSPSVHSGYEFTDFDAGPALDGQGRVIDPAPGQNGWTFKHAQNDIKNMVTFRVGTYGTAVTNTWTSTDGTALAFGRGDKGHIVINNGHGQIQREFTTSLPDGTYPNVIKSTLNSNGTWTGESVTVSNGKFTVTVGGKDAVAILNADSTPPEPPCDAAIAPGAPSGLSAAASGTSVQLSWTAASKNGGCDLVNYTITRTGGGNTVTVNTAGLGTSFTDTGLSANTAYTYSVRAHNEAAKSSQPSNSVTVTTQEAPTGTTVYYQPDSWSSANMHFRVGNGSWTVAPGQAMQASAQYPGWYQLTIPASSGTITAAFNNGSSWDNNGGQDYAIPAGTVVHISGGTVSAGPPASTPDPPADSDPLPGQLDLFYKPTGNWSSVYAHHRVGTGSWTAVPGAAMSPVASCDAGGGWFHLRINASGADAVTIAFNNGSGSWDNNGGQDYVVRNQAVGITGGVITPANPCAADPVIPEEPGEPGDPEDPPAPGTTKVYYQPAGWTSANIHYRVDNGAWTAVPGQAMTAAEQYPGWFVTDIPAATGTITAAFNNGSTWDSNGGQDYSIPAGAVVRVADGTVASGAPTLPPPTSDLLPGTLDLFYQPASSWSAAYAHHRVGTGAWTAAPGTQMTAVSSCAAGAGWFHTSIDAAGANSVTIAFNNGSGSWDSNGGADYVVTNQAVGITGGTITAADPCATDPVVPQEPEEPGNGEDEGEPGDGEDPTDPPAPVDYDLPGTDYSVAHYGTNPNGQTGKFQTITVDGNPDEWTADMIIAQGVANDDPRIFRGSHEGPVYDPYALYAAWDDVNLYLMWQFTNVTDVVDPAQGYPISDNGKPYQLDIPQAIALDVIPNRGGDGVVYDGTNAGVWGMQHSFTNKEVDHLLMFSSKPGVGQPSIFSLNDDDEFDYAPANVTGFTAAGVTYAYGDGFHGNQLLGVNQNGYQGYTPADLTDPSNFVNLLDYGHDTAQDTVYEMKIPLASLGINRATLESQGISAMFVATFGAGAIGSLPYDPATLDNALLPYPSDTSTSFEKEDWDEFSAQFALIGRL